MPRVPKPLTDTEVRSAKPAEKEYVLGDGQGLLLRVKPNGSKVWLFNYTSPTHRKRVNLGLGNYPTISLSAARKLGPVHTNSSIIAAWKLPHSNSRLSSRGRLTLSDQKDRKVVGF